MRRLKNWQNFDKFSIFVNKIDRFIATHTELEGEVTQS